MLVLELLVEKKIDLYYWTCCNAFIDIFIDFNVCLMNRISNIRSQWSEINSWNEKKPHEMQSIFTKALLKSLDNLNLVCKTFEDELKGLKLY